MNSNRSSLPKDQIDAVKLSIQQKKYDRALELLNKISNKEDNLNIVNRITASVYLYKKDWEKSLSYFQKIDNKNNFGQSCATEILLSVHSMVRWLCANRSTLRRLFLLRYWLPFAQCVVHVRRAPSCWAWVIAWRIAGRTIMAGKYH